MKKKASAESHVTLKIPRPLYDQLKQVIVGSGFHSVTEFTVYVLRDLLSHRERRPDKAAAAAAGLEVDPLSPEEIEAIRDRLQSLGYL
ncbi:MAG: CopG family transcriptional regulator [Actinomycetota bacterium]|nr:CopG family transcriptional regulator [Actinomycetota bacterium]